MDKTGHYSTGEYELRITVAELFEALQDISNDDELIVAAAHHILNRRTRVPAGQDHLPRQAA